MSFENEPSPADGDKKIEDNVHDNYEKMYQEQLKKDQDAIEARIRGETAVQFDNVRKLGFVTKNDIDESIKNYYGKIMEENKKLREEFTGLREWVMRAKAQGFNSGAVEETTQQNSLSSHQRFNPDMFAKQLKKLP